MNNIEVDYLIKKLEKESLNIIDIRQPIKYYNGKIPTAINIEEQLLTTYPKKYLSKEKKYYIYCSYGNLSNKVVEYLNSQGYDTVNIIGGYNNYLLRK